jgi:hypothetical protein
MDYYSRARAPSAAYVGQDQIGLFPRAPSLEKKARCRFGRGLLRGGSAWLAAAPELRLSGLVTRASLSARRELRCQTVAPSTVSGMTGIED